ncbi:hypothetical protein E2C01_047541 [Portunus trituberculatus]|uniref:Uncharacterized protein n=1 Tax=Portunus trituberculatus TaxID=210409 RepID=A0A5B7G8U2_PORTR|nr:hypothetical protein [Portunus trituberculatus]
MKTRRGTEEVKLLKKVIEKEDYLCGMQREDGEGREASPERHESCGNVLTRLSKQQPLVPPRHKGPERQAIEATWLHQATPGGDFTREAREGPAIRTLENCTSSHEKVSPTLPAPSVNKMGPYSHQFRRGR